MLYLVWRNLVRKPLRLWLTLFAIVIAFLIWGVLGSFMANFGSAVDSSADNRMVTVNKVNFTQPLPSAYVNKIRALEGVETVSWQSWFGAYYREPSNVMVAMAIEPDTYLTIYGDMLRLPPEQREAFLKNRQGAIVGERLARRQGWKVGDRVPIQSNIYSRADGSHTWEMDIAGIFTRKRPEDDTNSMYFHWKYLDEARSFGKDNVGMIVFRTKNPADNDRIADVIDAQFANSFYETQTDTAKAFNRAFVAQFGNIALIIKAVVSAAFFTILLIVANTMVLAIRERTTEIAVLKTLGFRSSRVFAMVLGESLLLACGGGLLGLGLAWVAIGLMKQSLSDVVPQLALGLPVVLQAIGFMVALGLVTGIVPAYAALRLNIITALGRD